MSRLSRVRAVFAKGLVPVAAGALFLSGCGAGHEPPQAAPQAKSVPARSPSHLGDFARQMAELGGSPLEVLASGAGIAGDSLTAFVSIPQGRCAALAARGAPSVADIDLYLFAEDGDELGASDAIEEPATLLHCAESGPLRVLAFARIAAGRGAFSLGLVDLPQKQANAARARLTAASGVPPATPEDFPGLDAELGAHRDALGGTWRDLRRVLLPLDHRLPTQLDVTIEPERCVDALLMPGPGLLDLDMEALDASGGVLGRAEALGEVRALLVCAGADPGRVSLRIRPHAGRGAALLAVSQTAHESSRRDLHPEFPKVDLSPPREPAPALRAGAERHDLSVDRMVTSVLGWTGCQRVDLEPHYPLLGYSAAAYDGDGRLVGHYEGAAKTQLYLCVPKSSAGPGRLLLRATRRAGPLDIWSLAESAPARTVLERHPLAASRLLGLAEDLGFLQRISDIGQVSAHELGPDQLVRIPLAVPAERCLTMLAAADRSGPAIELGVVATETARFVDFARGAHVAWTRVCAAQGRTEDFIVELRAPHGETAALLATRQETLTPRSAALLR